MLQLKASLLKSGGKSRPAAFHYPRRKRAADSPLANSLPPDPGDPPPTCTAATPRSPDADSPQPNAAADHNSCSAQDPDNFLDAKETSTSTVHHVVQGILPTIQAPSTTLAKVPLHVRKPFTHGSASTIASASLNNIQNTFPPLPSCIPPSPQNIQNIIDSLYSSSEEESIVSDSENSAEISWLGSSTLSSDLDDESESSIEAPSFQQFDAPDNSANTKSNKIGRTSSSSEIIEATNALPNHDDENYDDDLYCDSLTDEEKNPGEEEANCAPKEMSSSGITNEETTSDGGITVMTTNNYGNKRRWDKKDYCLFCQKPQAKLMRHVTTVHKNEHKIALYVAENDQKQKNKMALEIRNRGNHLHNCEVIRRGEGSLIVGYRPKKQTSYTEYGPCDGCLVYLHKHDLWRHKCPLKSLERKNGRNQRASKSQILMPAPKGVSQQLGNLLKTLSNDQITRTAKSDPLITSLGEKLFIRRGHDKDNHNDIRSHLRRLAKLLIQLRKESNLPDASLGTFIHPRYFGTVIQACRAVSGYDESEQTYKWPSLALKIGYSLKKCSSVVQSKAIESCDKDTETNASSFLQLCDLNWQDEISAHALRTLNQTKRNKTKVIPLTQDIMKMSKSLRTAGTHFFDNLSNHNEFDPDSWRKLNEITLGSIILFNRRRSGEVSKAKLTDFHRRPKPNGDKVCNSELTACEQELCRSLQRFEIIGERDRNVPVLLTEVMCKWLSRLISTRGQAGVSSENDYLFPRSCYGGNGHIRGTDVLRVWSESSGAKNPEALRSTNLRKQIAIVSQIVNLRENELDILAQFMGHDVRVHREYYRLPQETLQIAKVAKLLLASEKGEKISGKRLEEIEVTPEDGEINY